MTDHPIQPGATWEQLAPVLRQVLADDGADAGANAIVVETSGSSGTPKRVRLSGAALRASGEATATVLGGPGRWVLALPTHHVAGLQVLARSVLAGTEPVAMDPGMPFGAESFAVAVRDARQGGGQGPDGEALRLYVSLVPTQLHRILADPTGVGPAALRLVDAVLLGGAAADPGLLQRARAHTRVLTTYGMSETCGGCVYDGVPLPGVVVRIEPENDRILLGGPVLADGYPGQPGLSAEHFVTDAEGRWFRTDDRGRWQDGRLQVLGRLDDVIITGGHKVEPRDVEQALQALPEVAEAVVVPLPDDEWGQVVAAVLTSTGHARPDAAALREALTSSLPPHAAPRQLLWRDGIPHLPSGKPDRAAATVLVQDAPGG